MPALLLSIALSVATPTAAATTLSWSNPLADEPIEKALARLSAPASDDRSRAQDWLAAHLSSTDFAVVRKAASDGDAEVRARLVNALSDSDRCFDIAVRLANDGESALSDVGRQTLGELISRWSPGLARDGMPRNEVLSKLRGKLDRRMVLDPRLRSGELDVALDQLARFSGAAPPIVLDPDLVRTTDARARAGEITGTFDALLAELCALHRVGLEGFGFDDDLEGEAQRWILVEKRGAEGQSSARDRCIDWCLRAGGAGLDGDRSACARSLAASGWPAAMAWLEERWRSQRDETALEGILLAAGRGRVVPALASPAAQRQLYAAMDRAAVAPERAGLAHAGAIARALAAAGPIGPAGEDLAPIAFESASPSPRELWLRLVVLEGQRSASRATLAKVDVLLGDLVRLQPMKADQAALCFQGLRARVAIARGGDPPPLTRVPAELFEWAGAHGRARDLEQLFVRSGVPLPAEWNEPQALPARWSADLRATVLAWSFARAPVEITARHLSAMLADPAPRGLSLESLAAIASGWVRAGERERWESCTAILRKSPSAPSISIDTLELLSGIGSDEVRARTLARLSASAPARRVEWLGLGALCAGPRGGEARSALVKALDAPGDLEDRLAALDRAVSALRAARDDEGERDFVKAVRAAVRESGPVLRARLRADVWPAPVRSEPFRPAELDRRLEEAGLEG